MTAPHPPPSPAPLWAVPVPERRSGRRRFAVPVLIVLSVMLLIGGLVMVGLARNSLARQDAKLAELRAQRAADIRQGLPVQPSPPPLSTAALRTQLIAIQTADAQIDTTAARWRQGGVQLKIVWESVGKCMYQVDRYNRTASWFTATQLKGLPTAIDLNARATDCGKATLATYAKGAQY